MLPASKNVMHDPYSIAETCDKCFDNYDELIVRTLEHPICYPNRLYCRDSDDDRLPAAVDPIIQDKAKRKRIDTNTHAVSRWECVLDLLCNLYKQSSVAISWYRVLYNYICDGCVVASLS
ncbi:MAG: hypothetical protein MUO26_02545 [Methanotrichaceae archaeon]|nr:hypothetical protein [Methanotrichaceae archaeon]